MSNACAARRATTATPLSLLECTQIVGHVRMFRRQRFDIADFDVDFLYAGPFCARAEEPAPLSHDPRRVERIGSKGARVDPPADPEPTMTCSLVPFFVQH